MRLLIVITITLVAGIANAKSNTITSYAVVQDNATLRMRGETIRLVGVFVPDMGRQCRSTVLPIRCGLSRAAEALDFVIQGFVRCRIVQAYSDGSVGGFCATGYTSSSNGTDLGGYLVSEGLAVATDGAPPQYRALERIARSNGLGVWGFQVDVIR